MADIAPVDAVQAGEQGEERDGLMMNVVVMTTVSTPRISLSFVVPSSLAVSSLCVAFM